MIEREPTIEQAAREYFDSRGIVLAVRCSRCVRASRLKLTAVEDEQRLTMKVHYIGPAEEHSEEALSDNDPWCYRWIGSPFPETPRESLSYGFVRDGAGDVWMDCYAHVCLRDPSLYDKGVRIELEVPEIVAEKRPNWQILCNGEVMMSGTITSAGRISGTIDIRNVSQELITYITDLRRQQKIVISEIGRICDKYHLNWYLICGGLIGLVRDHALIPWDDDLDIAMSFDDYQRFVSAVRSEWSDGRMVLVLPEEYGDGVFLDQMSRVVYMRECISGDPFERLGKKARTDLHNHLAMDLYILQDAYENRFKHWLQTRTLQFLYGLALGHREVSSFAGNRWEARGKVAAAKILSRIGRHMPLAFIQRRYDAVMRRSTHKRGRSYFQANGYHACVPIRFDKSWFGRGIRMMSHGMEFRVPVQADKFLKKMYGNYREPPFFFYRKPAHWRGAEEEFYGG